MSMKPKVRVRLSDPDSLKQLGTVIADELFDVLVEEHLERQRGSKLIAERSTARG